MGTFTIDAPNGKSYTIEGENAQGALAALQKHLGSEGQATTPKTTYSGSILPLSRDEKGNVHFDSDAGLVGMVKRAVMLPGDAAQGKFNVQPEQPGMWSEADQERQNMADQELVKRADELAGLISPTSAATRAGFGVAGVTGNAIKREAVAPTSDQLVQAYRSVRNSPEVTGVNIPIQDVKNISTAAENDLLKSGFRPTQASASDTFRELGNMRPKPPPEPTPQQKLQAEMNWETLPEAPQVKSANMDDILAARQAFGQTARQRKSILEGGGATPDAAASQQVIGKLNDLIEEHAPSMIEANANYNRAMASNAIDARFDKAELKAVTTNSGLNVGNKLRQQAADIITNPAASRSLDPEAKAALEELARGTATRNTIRWFANVLGGGGGLGAEVTGDIASRHLGPVGWLFSPVGKAIKHLENNLTVSAANKISEAIRARSPLGKAIESSAQKWNDAHGAFLSKPSSAGYAAFSIASRNLANTLSGTGTKIDAGPLLRAIQGPAPSRAQDEQQ